MRRLLGTSTERHLSKVLLEFLDNEQPLSAYQKYLSDTVSFSVSHQSVSMFQPKLLEKFYVQEDPLVSPKYFDFFNDSNISKLESALGQRLIILMESEGAGTWTKVHDQRVYDRISPLFAQEPLFFLVEKSEGEVWKLYHLTGEADKNSYVQILSEAHLVTEKTLFQLSEGSCILQVLASVHKSSLEAHRHSDSCQSLADLIFSREKARLARELGTQFILCSHLRSSLKSRARNRHHPRDNFFGVHAVFSYDSNAVSDFESHSVVCVTQDLKFYKLETAYADLVRTTRARQRYPKKQPFPGAASDLLLKRKVEERQKAVDDDSSDHFIHDASCQCEACQTFGRFKHNMSFNGPQQMYQTDLSTFDLFKLLGWFDSKVEKDLMNVCSLSMASFDVESFASPVPDSVGNEDLNFQPSTFSHLKLPREVKSIHEPCKIGFTDQLRLETGREVVIFDLDPDKPERLVSDFLECILEHRDAAVCIKYGVLTEYLESLELYQQKHFEFFVLKGWLPANYGSDPKSSEEQQRQLAVEQDVLEGSAADMDEADEILDEVVRELATELGTEDDDAEVLISDQDTMDSWASAAAVKDAKQREARIINDIEKSWENSIFGILQRRLHYLARCYHIFGFNTEGFDSVLLASRLITYAKESGRRDVKMCREGARIKYIIIDSVRFSEIKRLLGPGTSLASLAKACNLEEEKFIFPFARFTSLSFLWEKELPRNAADWASDLNPEKTPSQDEVDAAIRLFHEKGFQSISSYLDYYLRLDVIITQQAVVKMSLVYYDILGLNIVDSRRLTVSSLASCAAQTFLARHKRPACYFPNHQRLYSLLKMSLRGGITGPTRAVSGEAANIDTYVELLKEQMESGGEDGGPDLELCRRVEASGLTLEDYIHCCNAHQLPAGEAKKAKSTVYADVNR